MGVLAFVGCDNRPAADPPHSDEHDHEHEGDHDHGHSHDEGPHDGTVADWGGGKYHIEFTVDHDKQEATVYILGDDGKSPLAIKAEEIDLVIKDPAMEVKLKAAPQEGDADGTTSRFVGTHESLGVVQEYTGTITGVVDDTPYSGDFKEEAHKH